LEIREVHRSFLRLLILTLLVLFAAPASAQYTRDAAANRKIDEAINTHYLATEFDKAESVLSGTVKACEDKCSPQTLAKAWMYIGIVRGSGRNDQNGAREAFQQAMTLDPAVKLDAGLATPETQASFNASGGGGTVETPATPATGNGGGEATGGGNGLDCTPSVTEVETRRPIPVQCKSDEEVTSLELRYKAFGSETWKTVRMERKGASFRAQVPCDATQTAGTLKVYVQGKDVKGEAVSNWGSKNEPIEIQLVEQSTAEPPSYDDADPPARCAAKEICPPDFPGCEASGGGGGTAAAGAACNSSSVCKAGLLCIDGTCDTAPSCSTNSDCPGGSCEDGKCTAGEGSGVIARKPKKMWIGLHLAQDWVLFGGEKPCLGDAKFACYLTNSSTQPYDTQNFQTTDVGKISNGLVFATTRVLLSFDYAVIPSLTLGVRAGFAFGGGPPSGRKVEWDTPGGITVVKVNDQGKSFMPFHAEVRAAYWFGQNPLAKRGLRPYVQVGGGLAQVDAKVIVKVEDNGSQAARDLGTETTADAWKKLGQVFIEGGGGAVYAITPSFGVQLNLNAMVMLGSSGFALEPSLGAVVGL